MKKHVTNDTDKPKYVGDILIPPGGTRLVEVLEESAEETAAPADPLDVLRAMLAGKVTDITAALPGLSVFQIDNLLVLEREKGEKARSTLVTALEAAALARVEPSGDGLGTQAQNPGSSAGEGGQAQNPGGSGEGGQAQNPGNGAGEGGNA